MGVEGSAWKLDANSAWRLDDSIAQKLDGSSIWKLATSIHGIWTEENACWRKFEARRIKWIVRNLDEVS